MNVKPKELSQPLRGRRVRKTRKESTERLLPVVPVNWDDAISRIKKRSFTSIQDALEGVINEVLGKFGPNEDQDARDTITLLLESNPHIIATIERLLVKRME
jgi:hypothetical protein